MKRGLHVYILNFAEPSGGPKTRPAPARRMDAWADLGMYMLIAPLAGPWGLSPSWADVFACLGHRGLGEGAAWRRNMSEWDGLVGDSSLRILP